MYCIKYSLLFGSVMTQSSSPPPVSDDKDGSIGGVSSAVKLLEKPLEKASEGSADEAFKLPDQLQQSIASFERSVKLVAENLRYGSWTKRLATIGGVAFIALNPLAAGKVAETFGVEKLPRWYVTAFWGGLGGLGGLTVVAAAVTLPKKPGAEVDTSQNRAIKGLRSFELKDADIFAKLQRQRDVQECYEAVTAPTFRFGVLMGESGCGKSSLLQAGLLPKLMGEGATHRGVYVKMGDRSPLDAIRAALIKELGEAAVGDAKTDFLTTVTQAAQVAGKPLVLVLDQFEQFFVQYKRAEERADFVQVLKAWYVSEVPVRVLVGIREDLSGRLIEIQKALGYSLGPMDSFRLEKFSPSQATAVLREMARLERLDFNEPFMEELARKELAGAEDALISPVDVQVLAWMIVRQSEEELRAFNQRSFQRLGGVEGVLQRFLERTLAALMGAAQRSLAVEALLALTDRERNVRAGMLSLDELQVKLKGKGLPAEIGEMMAWLARGDVRLVTVEERETGLGYELAHERLIPALLRVAGQELSAADRANQLLNRRVNEWVGNGRSQRYLFNW